MPEDLPDHARTPDTLPLYPPAPPQVLAEPAVSPDEPSAPEIRFEPPPGESAPSSLTVELLCEAPGALIRYGLGAEDVDQGAPLYDASEKILLTQSAVIVARAWVGDVAGPLASVRYEIAKVGWEKREPEDQSDATAHQEARGLTFEDGWRAAAASARGKLHAHRGLWREDAFDIAQAESPAGTWAILTVADGAGSAPLARVGSRLACSAATESLRASLCEQELNEDAAILRERDLPLLRDKLAQAARVALQVLESEAQQRQRPLGDFASTLLILVRCDWAQQQVCGALQVGDGAIALQDHDGQLTILGQADHGEHSSETRFLTTPGIEPELESRARFSIRTGLSAVAVLSDGVSDDFFPEQQRLPMMLAQVLPLVQGSGGQDGSALLRWLGYEKKGSSDDRTIIMSWSGEAASTCGQEIGSEQAEKPDASQAQAQDSTGAIEAGASPEAESADEGGGEDEASDGAA